MTPAQAMAINADGRHRTGALPDTHVEVEQRTLVEPFQQLAMAGFGRTVPDRAVVEGERVDHHQREHRRRDDVAVEHDRDRAVAGGHGRRRDRDQFGATHLAQDLERIGDAGDAAHRFLYRGALAGKALVVDPGATSHPRSGLATGQRCRDRGRRRGVADTDLAEDEQVAVERIDGVEGDVGDLVESVAGERRFVADVAGGVRRSRRRWPEPRPRRSGRTR